MSLDTPLILDATGKPMRPATSKDACPNCRKKGKQFRVPSGGFGVPWPVCVCGYEWKDEVWLG